MHPSDRIRGETASTLAGTRVVLGVSGSIAAVKCVELARELIRRGAEVRAVTTPSGLGIVHPDALGFATGEDVVTELTGRVEHVELGGEDGWGDVLLLAPATANTLGKVAQGIDDTPVTSVASVALGHLPVVACPAMHGTMYDNPAVRENVDRLRDWGVEIVEPTEDEGKAKLAPVASIVAHVERAVDPRDLDGRSVLVVTGGTRQPVDAVRTLENRSTGRTGIALAKAAFRRGADVTLWAGHGGASLPPHLPVRRFSTVDDLLEMAPDAERFDAVLCPAAIADYRPLRREGKVPSERDGEAIDLEPVPKVLPRLREACDGTVVGFKLEVDVSDAELLERAAARRKRHGLDAIVANRLEDRDAETGAGRLFVIDGDGHREAEGSLRELAGTVVEQVIPVA